MPTKIIFDINSEEGIFATRWTEFNDIKRHL